jgi:hypothetical protein
MKLSEREIISVMRKGGWGPYFDCMISAIALRESGGDPAAFNGDAATGDESYGLLQLNLLRNTQALMTLYGITDKKQLFDPLTNARAGWLLSGGAQVTPAQRLANMRTAWYFDRATNGQPTQYKIRYEQHLGAVLVAAAQLV